MRHDFITNQENIQTDKEYCFRRFNEEVVSHINNYVVPQYGDNGDDPATEYTLDDLKKQIQKYAARIGNGQRGYDECLRDSLKIAHYSQMLHDLIQKAKYDSQIPDDYG